MAWTSLVSRRSLGSACTALVRPSSFGPNQYNRHPRSTSASTMEATPAAASSPGSEDS